jgi:hypothetical protein
MNVEPDKKLNVRSHGDELEKAVAVQIFFLLKLMALGLNSHV